MRFGHQLGTSWGRFWCPLGTLWGLFGHPRAPFGTLQILETPSDQLLSNFGVTMGAPKEPNGGPKILKMAQNVPNMRPRWPLMGSLVSFFELFNE